MQGSDEGEEIAVPRADWTFGYCINKPFSGEPDPTKICLRNGFESSLLYQVVFTAKDPLVLGIGFAATRDIVSFLRHSRNPAGVFITHTIAFSTSQSGNFLKTLLNLGFNQDEQKRIVLDGMNPNIAARQMPSQRLAVRLAQHLIERAIVGRVQRAPHAVGGDTGFARTVVDVTAALRAWRSLLGWPRHH